jgi:hypothetical protein
LMLCSSVANKNCRLNTTCHFYSKPILWRAEIFFKSIFLKKGSIGSIGGTEQTYKVRPNTFKILRGIFFITSHLTTSVS